MAQFTDLPPELLSRIAEEAADIEDNRFYNCYTEREDDGEEPIADSGMTFPGLASRQSRMASLLLPGLDHLRSLRAVSRQLSQICTPQLFRIVKVMPTDESADRYNKILENEALRSQVRKVIFQTRESLDEDYNEEYNEPYDFFLEALEKTGQFPNLTCAELVFSEFSSGGDDEWFNDNLPEQIEFREPVLERFFAGLNHKDHPATGVHNLSIKNLQDKTPKALKNAEESEFKTDFTQVMSRIDQLSLQISTETYQASPEHDLEIPEAHDFFNEELGKYWLGPIRANLAYLKIYGCWMYWGYFPRANLPHFPGIKTLILGKMSISHDEQIDWITSHADTLEELVMDDCPDVLAARTIEHTLMPDNHIARTRQPSDHSHDPSRWTTDRRCHHVFAKLKQGLPKLKNFAYGHGDWDNGLAYDTADTITSTIFKDRYVYFDEGTGPSNWLTLDRATDECFNDWDSEEVKVYNPNCDDEDKRVLVELLDTVRKRH